MLGVGERTVFRVRKEAQASGGVLSTPSRKRSRNAKKTQREVDHIVVGGSGDDDIIEQDSSATAAPTAASERWRRLAEYASVGILFFINLINYMDRYTVA
ncbi:hypothetical protein MTO96_039695, partial [Rhipicephalus appendiculatus]